MWNVVHYSMYSDIVLWANPKSKMLQINRLVFDWVGRSCIIWFMFVFSSLVTLFKANKRLKIHHSFCCCNGLLSIYSLFLIENSKIFYLNFFFVLFIEKRFSSHSWWTVQLRFDPFKNYCITWKWICEFRWFEFELQMCNGKKKWSKNLARSIICSFACLFIVISEFNIICVVCTTAATTCTLF